MRRVCLLMVLLLAALATGCDSDPTRSGGAQLRILLTDAPLDLSAASAVNVTVTEFRAYPRDDAEEGSGVVVDTLDGGDLTVNLLDYQNGVTTTVATAEIPEGDYGRIRMVLVSAELVWDDDGDAATPEAVEPLFIPSEKVDIPVPFSVSAGEGMEITLDFDAERSVQVNATSGQHPYILRPVVTPVGISAF